MNFATTHPYTVEELMAFCDGELSTKESQAFESHLAECRECADQVRHFREASQSLSQWNAPPVSQRIEEAVEDELQGGNSGRGSRGSKAQFGRARRPRWRPWAIAGASALATVMLLVVIGVSVSIYSNSRTASDIRVAAVAGPSEAPGGSGQSSPYVGDTSYADAPRPAAVAGTMNNQLSAPPRTNAVPPPPTPPPANGADSSAPLIARSVSFAIVAKDIPAARSALDAILARDHGYAAQMTVYTPADDAPSLKASLRIPVANLAAAIEDLRGLGQVASEEESGEDVTQQHADLDQRLKTARDTEERFRTILQQRTGSVNDVLQVEEEIARVRGDIESMEAEQANLDHRVDFASIDLSVTGESSPVSGSAPLSVRVRSAFVAGYRNAAGTVIGIFLFLAAYGLTILIWIALLGLPVYLLRRRYRRMRAKL